MLIERDTGLVRAAVLVHTCSSFRQALDTLFLRTPILRSPVSRRDSNHATGHGRLARLISVRGLVPNLADLV